MHQDTTVENENLEERIQKEFECLRASFDGRIINAKQSGRTYIEYHCYLNKYNDSESDIRNKALTLLDRHAIDLGFETSWKKISLDKDNPARYLEITWH